MIGRNSQLQQLLKKKQTISERQDAAENASQEDTDSSLKQRVSNYKKYTPTVVGYKRACVGTLLKCQSTHVNTLPPSPAPEKAEKTVWIPEARGIFGAIKAQ